MQYRLFCPQHSPIHPSIQRDTLIRVVVLESGLGLESIFAGLGFELGLESTELGFGLGLKQLRLGLGLELEELGLGLGLETFYCKSTSKSINPL